MTQEEKQLLFLEICSKFPYKVKVLYLGEICTIDIIGNDYSVLLLAEDGYRPKIEDGLFINIENIKLYLRPLSSITEEENSEINLMVNNHKYGDCSRSGAISDYLDAHYLDYRDLIGKGLALPASEEIYK